MIIFLFSTSRKRYISSSFTGTQNTRTLWRDKDKCLAKWWSQHITAQHRVCTRRAQHITGQHQVASSAYNTYCSYVCELSVVHFSDELAWIRPCYALAYPLIIFAVYLVLHFCPMQNPDNFVDVDMLIVFKR